MGGCASKPKDDDSSPPPPPPPPPATIAAEKQPVKPTENQKDAIKKKTDERSVPETNKSVAGKEKAEKKLTGGSTNRSKRSGHNPDKTPRKKEIENEMVKQNEQEENPVKEAENPQGAAPQADENEYRIRLIGMYEKYDPSLIPEVDTTLNTWRGNEEEMFRNLVERYGPEPDRIPQKDDDDVKKSEVDDKNEKKEVVEEGTLGTHDGTLDGPVAVEADTEIAVEEQPREATDVEPKETTLKADNADSVPSDEQVVGLSALEEEEQHRRESIEEDQLGKRNFVASIEEEVRAQWKAALAEREFYRRLSGYLGIRAPHILRRMNESDKIRPNDYEEVFASLEQSYGPEPTEREIREYFVQRLERFYAVHDPELVQHARQEMSELVYLEEEYMQMMIAKYGEDPSLSSNPDDSRMIPSKGPDSSSISHVTGESDPHRLNSVNRQSSTKWWYRERPGKTADEKQRRRSSATKQHKAIKECVPSGIRPESEVTLYSDHVPFRTPHVSTVHGTHLPPALEESETAQSKPYEKSVKSVEEEDSEFLALVEGDELWRVAREQQQLIAEQVQETEDLRRIVRERHSVSSSARGDSRNASSFLVADEYVPSDDEERNEYAENPDNVLDRLLDDAPPPVIRYEDRIYQDPYTAFNRGGKHIQLKQEIVRSAPPMVHISLHHLPPPPPPPSSPDPRNPICKLVDVEHPSLTDEFPIRKLFSWSRGNKPKNENKQKSKNHSFSKPSKSLSSLSRIEPEWDESPVNSFLYGDSMPPPFLPSVIQKKQEDIKSRKRNSSAAHPSTYSFSSPASPSMKDRLMTSRLNISRKSASPKGSEHKTLDQLRMEYEFDRSSIDEAQRGIEVYSIVTV